MAVVVAVVLIAGSRTLSAQDEQGGGVPKVAATAENAALNRTLKKTHFKTVNGSFLNLTTTFVNAFSDTIVTCPGSSGTCTIAVTVVSQFGQVDAGAVARARVFVNGVLAHPSDACCLNFSPNPENQPQTSSMIFVATGVPVGNRLVQVQFATSAGTAYADYRSLRIEVYRP
jgi:hypothetical protein